MSQVYCGGRRLHYPGCQECENTRKGRQREAWGINDTNNGGKRVQMLAEDVYGAIQKKFFQKDAHGAK